LRADGYPPMIGQAANLNALGFESRVEGGT
jgi:hypothetical protein